MRVLLDTQVWLWIQAHPGRLNPGARQLVEDPASELFLSAASAWEIAIKYTLGRLPLPDPPTVYVPTRMARGDTRPLPVAHDHALRVAAAAPPGTLLIDCW